MQISRTPSRVRELKLRKAGSREEIVGRTPRGCVNTLFPMVNTNNTEKVDVLSKWLADKKLD